MHNVYRNVGDTWHIVRSLIINSHLRRSAEVSRFISAFQSQLGGFDDAVNSVMGIKPTCMYVVLKVCKGMYNNDVHRCCGLSTESLIASYIHRNLKPSIYSHHINSNLQYTTGYRNLHTKGILTYFTTLARRNYIGLTELYKRTPPT